MTRTTRHGEPWVLGFAIRRCAQDAAVCSGQKEIVRNPCPIFRLWGPDAWAVRLRLKGTSSSIQNGGHSFRTLGFISVGDIKGICRKTTGYVVQVFSCADNKFGQKFDDLTKALLTSTKMFEESSQNDLIGRWSQSTLIDSWQPYLKAGKPRWSWPCNARLRRVLCSDHVLVCPSQIG